MQENIDHLELLNMKLGFEQWAKDEGLDLSTVDDETGYCDSRTFDAWRGYYAAHKGHGVQPVVNQLVAEIKKSSKYAHQAVAAQRQGMPYPFQVHIEDDQDGYVVLGGYGGRYRLEDVDLFVIDEQGRKVRIN